jgi:superfamily II DNA or RNA helicase
MSKKQLRAHQEAALTAMASAVKLIVNLPTGTGKSLIQSRSIATEINKTCSGVYVVLTPRILLSNQLFRDIKEDLANQNLDAQYLIVNSGNNKDKDDEKWFKAIRAVEKNSGITYRELESTTSSTKVKETYEKALRENVPLVIIGNYHSAGSIVAADLPVDVLYCDEAHYLVPGEETDDSFSQITTDWFKADRKYYFTATMKYSDGSYGMNSVERFGEQFSMLPVDLIKRGEIIKPRMHLIEMQASGDSTEDDVEAVIAAFNEHRALLSIESSSYIAPKLLVVAKGSDHLDRLANHPKMKKLLSERRNLKLFDISSAYEPRIDGKVVSREEFLRVLQGLGDHDEAIVIHVRILTEGINVPGITGILPLNNLKKAMFLQTLGRATRLHGEDRSRLYAEEMLPEEITKFVKPYAWVIIPTYGDLGSEIYSKVSEMIEELRTYGFNPFEDIFIKVSQGQVKPESLDTILKDPKKKVVSNTSIFVYNVNHVVEDAEIANHLQALNSATEEEALELLFN